MNLDVLDNNKVKWWWYAILSAAVFIIVLAGWAIFKHASVRPHVPTTRSYSGVACIHKINRWSRPGGVKHLTRSQAKHYGCLLYGGTRNL